MYFTYCTWFIGLYTIYYYQKLLIFPFSALAMVVGRPEGLPACKNLGVGLLVVMISLEL